MALSVLKVYPGAKLLIARLDDSRLVEDQKFTISSCLDALRWALGKGVQVVSMSWTFKYSENDEHAREFAKLINRNKNRVVFFGSLPDKALGTETDTYAPLCFENVIKIGAATVYGTSSEVNAHTKYDFTLPGENLYGFASGKPESGSSYATAYAAGLAASMLYCIRSLRKMRKYGPGKEAEGAEEDSLPNIKPDGSDRDDEDNDGELANVWNLATTKKGMSNIFKELCNKEKDDHDGTGRFVIASATLGTSFEESEEAQRAELVKIVNLIVPQRQRENK